MNSRVDARSISLCLVFAALGGAMPSRGDEIPPQKLDGTISWVYHYAEGKQLARETGKPLFVVFRCER
jgi:hypothetical protein